MPLEYERGAPAHRTFLSVVASNVLHKAHCDERAEREGVFTKREDSPWAPVICVCSLLPWGLKFEEAL
eukprot:6180412-Pleurochrysis_carterae.AAC.2